MFWGFVDRTLSDVINYLLKKKKSSALSNHMNILQQLCSSEANNCRLVFKNKLDV